MRQLIYSPFGDGNLVLVHLWGNRVGLNCEKIYIYFSLVVKMFSNTANLSYPRYETNSNQKLTEHFQSTKSNPTQEYHEFNYGTITRTEIKSKKIPL